MAFDLANSSAVTHCCLSTSELALRWNVRDPLLEMTKLHESCVWMNALARLIVPRHVLLTSAGFLSPHKYTSSTYKHRLLHVTLTS